MSHIYPFLLAMFFRSAACGGFSNHPLSIKIVKPSSANLPISAISLVILRPAISAAVTSGFGCVFKIKPPNFRLIISPNILNITSEVWIFVNEANFEWHQTIKNAKNSYILGTFFILKRVLARKNGQFAQLFRQQLKIWIHYLSFCNYLLLAGINMLG